MERLLIEGSICFIAGAALSLLFAPWAKRLSLRFGLIDKPGERRIHTTAVPRGGGIGIFVAFHLVAWIFFEYFEDTQSILDLRWWRGFLCGSFVVFFTGLLDDKVKLTAGQKFLGQAVGALIFSHFTPHLTHVFGMPVPTEISIAVTLIWILIITNAFNLIDGIDGLATGLAAISSLGISGLLVERGMFTELILVIIFFGTLIGFFPYNRHPARMFLGDCGSNFIGFFLACVTLSTGAKGTAVATLAVPLMALAIPLLDTSLAIWRRSVRRVLGHISDDNKRNRITSGDLEHVHHRLLKTGLSTKNVTAVLCLANALLVLVGLLSFRSWSNPVALILTGVLLFSFILVRYLPLREGWESILMFHHLFARPKYPIIAAAGYLIWDSFSALIGLWLALSIAHPDFNVSVLFDAWKTIALSWCIGSLGVLIGYESIKASTSMQRILGVIFIILGLVALGVDIYLSEKSEVTLFTESSLYLLFFLLLSLSGRIAIAGVERTVVLRAGEPLLSPVYKFYSRL